jgi:hypothetical protein
MELETNRTSANRRRAVAAVARQQEDHAIVWLASLAVLTIALLAAFG